jgi:hypothetical protein
MILFIMRRMIPSQALTSAIPNPAEIWAFMIITASLKQIAGGFGAVPARFVIIQKIIFFLLQNYDTRL